MNFLKAKSPFIESLNGYDICHVFENDFFSLMREIIPEDDTKLYLNSVRENSIMSFNENDVTISFIPLNELID